MVYKPIESNFFNKIKGKPTDEMKEMKIRKFGEEDVKSFVPGAEIIELKEKKKTTTTTEDKAADENDKENDDEA